MSISTVLEATRRARRELDAATPAPAEGWEPITATQVRVGDHIEITKAWDGGTFVASGIVTAVCRTLVFFGPRNSFEMAEADGSLYTSVTIRRRVRQPMPEPDAPAVVKHAGRVLVRGEHDHSGWDWSVFRGLPVDCRDRNLLNAIRISWPEVLALDPAMNPVVVDLGGGEA